MNEIKSEKHLNITLVTKKNVHKIVIKNYKHQKSEKSILQKELNGRMFIRRAVQT